jgi:hypothetical protein
MKCLCNRRVLGWSLFALLLAGMAWALYVLLPPEPRWSRRGHFQSVSLTPTASHVVLVPFSQVRGNQPGDAAVVTVVDGQTGAEVGTFFHDAGVIHWWECSADGRFVIATGYDAIVRMADTRSGGERRVVVDEPGPFSHRLSPDGEHLLVAKEQHTANLIHVLSGKLLGSIERAGLPCAFSPDGDLLVHHTGQPPPHASLRVWDVRRGVAVAEIAGTEFLAFSSDGSTLYARQRERLGGRFDRVLLWDVATAKLRAELPVKPTDYLWFSLAADERTAAICTLEREGQQDRCRIATWDVASVRQIATAQIANFPAATATLSPDGRYLVARTPRQVILIDVHTGKERWQLGNELVWPDAEPVVCFTSNSQALVVRSKQDLEWRDAATGELLDTRFPTGQFIAAASRQWQRDRLMVNDIAGWAQPRQAGMLVQQLRRWLPATWLPEERNLLGTYVFNTRTREILFEQVDPQLERAMLSDDGQTVLTVHVLDGGERLVRCWDVPMRKSLRLVLGVPLACAAFVLGVRAGWRRWRRRAGGVVAARGGTPCP